MSVVLILICVASVIYLIKKKYKVLRVGWSIPGPWALPLIGNIQMVFKTGPEKLYVTFNENRAKFRQTYRLWLGPQLWVFLHTPEETRVALNDQSLVKADTFQQLSVLVGNGLLLSHGKHWENHRRALGPAFAPQILNTMLEAIEGHANELVNRIFKTISNNSDKAIEMDEFLFPAVLDTIIDTSMGKNVHAQQDVHCSYTHAFHSISALLFKRMTNPLLSSDFIFNLTSMSQELKHHIEHVQNLMETVISERAIFLKDQAQNGMGPKKRCTLLDTLLTSSIDGQPLSSKAIRDEVHTFVFAGVDTTNASMGFLLYALAKYPDEQARVFEEIETLLQGNDNEKLTMEDVNAMEYLDMFIKECLRLYTIVPVTGRETTRDTVIGGRQYCEGMTIWINMYGLAHDPELFEDPYEFRPQRFSKENMKELPPFAYIPFSGGPHVCIGRRYALQIMKIFTIKVLQNFEIFLRDPNEELTLMCQMVLKSCHGINLNFKAR